MNEEQYAARREAVARYLAREYEQTIEAARIRASEILALIHEPDPFAPGTRVEVHETDGGYLVFPADEDEDEDDWHDSEHPVWVEGCADCVDRADAIEANR